MRRSEIIRKKVALQEPILHLRNTMQRRMKLPLRKPLQRIRHINQSTTLQSLGKPPIPSPRILNMESQILVKQHGEEPTISVLVLVDIGDFVYCWLVDEFETAVARGRMEVLGFEGWWDGWEGF